MLSGYNKRLVNDINHNKIMKKIIATLLVSTFAMTAVSFAEADLNTSVNTNASLSTNEIKIEGEGKFKSFFNNFFHFNWNKNKENKNEDKKEDREHENRNKETKTNATSTLTTTQKACLSSAIAAHEDATITSFDTLYTSIRNALVARKVAIIAVVNADANATSTATSTNANISAYATYKTSLKNTLSTLKANQKTADANYQTAIKSCGLEGNTNSIIRLKNDSFLNISL